MKRQTVYTVLGVAVIFALLLSTPFSVLAQKRPRSGDDTTSRKIITQPRNTIDVDVWLDKQCGASYRQGEKIIINFRTTADGYVTVYDIDTRGNVSILFPNRHHPDNYVRGNQVYTIPNPSYSYDLVVEGPEGIEYVDIVATTDPYYQWNSQKGEPEWLYDWGLKGRQERDIRNRSSQQYKSSSEYQNQPQQFSETGKRSIVENYAKSQNLRDQIRSKIVARPRDTQSGAHASDTCYFYVVTTSPYQHQPRPQPAPSRDEYLWRQEQDFQRIPGLNVSRSGERLIVAIPNTILFDFDSFELRYDARRDLDEVADILIRYPETNIMVAGHTDSIGDSSYNQRLSEYRAQAVANYLISRGVQAYRISSVGYGETRPITSNASEAGRQRNRRVELDIRVSSQYGR
jgi:outer membrane protein OmpA-like peptidoglycan-associated protein